MARNDLLPRLRSSRCRPVRQAGACWLISLAAPGCTASARACRRGYGRWRSGPPLRSVLVGTRIGTSRRRGRELRAGRPALRRSDTGRVNSATPRSCRAGRESRAPGHGGASAAREVTSLAARRSAVFSEPIDRPRCRQPLPPHQQSLARGPWPGGQHHDAIQSGAGAATVTVAASSVAHRSRRPDRERGAAARWKGRSQCTVILPQQGLAVRWSRPRPAGSLGQGRRRGTAAGWLALPRRLRLPAASKRSGWRQRLHQAHSDRSTRCSAKTSSSSGSRNGVSLRRTRIPGSSSDSSLLR